MESTVRMFKWVKVVEGAPTLDAILVSELEGSFDQGAEVRVTTSGTAGLFIPRDLLVALGGMMPRGECGNCPPETKENATAGVFERQWIGIDRVACGSADGQSRLVESPVLFGDFEEAIRWLARQRDGWLQGAKNYFLVEARVGARSQIDDASCGGIAQDDEPVAMQPDWDLLPSRGELTPSALSHADQAWVGGMWQQALLRPRNLPLDWASRTSLKAPDWNSTVAEMAYVAGLQAKRGALQLQIESQAEHLSEVLRVVQAALASGGKADLPFRPAVKLLQQMLLSNIDGPVFHFKMYFNRARPWQIPQTQSGGTVVTPYFDVDSDARLPLWPSFPSRHATIAYAYAHLLKTWSSFAGASSAIDRAANLVALGREVAGVSFPSDSAGGKELGQKLAELLLEDVEFSAMYHAAMRELEG